MKPEINKMVTISTAHLSDETMKLMVREATDNNFPFIGVYPKAVYGFFIYIDKDAYREAKFAGGLPEDLVAVLDFTESVGCDILCLDCDAERQDDLKTYTW